MKYKVVEKFVSINGEGRLTGQLAVFIRFFGCNLNCNYCDTKWANQENCNYEFMTIEEIDEYIKSTSIINVTLTGGEPLLQENILELIKILLKEKNRIIEIETNGTIDIKPLKDLKNDRLKITMDYKLAGSGMEEYMLIKNFNELDYNDIVKFVLESESEFLRAKTLIENYNLTKYTNVYFSPSYSKISPEQIVEWMKKYLMNNVTLQLQIHKIIWNPNARGV